MSDQSKKDSKPKCMQCEKEKTFIGYLGRWICTNKECKSYEGG